MYVCAASYSPAAEKRIALMSSSSVSFLSFANPEKGDPNTGMIILLSCFCLEFHPSVPQPRFGG
jgi:hypothetical protein